VTGLTLLLESTQTATPERRIEFRDGIAAHGVTGIEAVRPWLADAVLAAFAVRVIEQAGVNGEPQLATKVLRDARTTVPESVRPDVDWALQRLRSVTHPAPVKAPAVAVRRAVVRPAPCSRRRPL